MLRWKSSLKPAAAASGPNDNFEFTVATTTSNETFAITCQNTGTFNATVDWGDGSTSTITAYNDADLTHTYATAGDHDISISGTFPNIDTSLSTDRLKIKSVTNLGSVGWVRLSNGFWGCSNMTSFTAGDCDTSSVTTMTSMFTNCTSLTSIDLSSLDTSGISSTSNMFYGCSSLTSIDVSGFDTSNVTNMLSMFASCSSLTSLDLSSFDTSNVTNLNNFVRDCTSLTSIDLSSFDVSSVVDGMNFMFDNCSSLTSLDLSSFVTSNLRYMRRMFYGMGGGTAQLTITGLEDFDITSLQYQLLFGTIHVGGFHEGLDNTGGISTTAYDELLVNWEAQTGYATNINAHFGPSKYTAASAAATARASLVSTGWTITDGGTA